MQGSPGTTPGGTIGSSQRRSGEFTLYTVLIITAIAIIGAMLFILRSGNQMIARIAPLADATMEIGVDATHAHLWMMEAALENNYDHFDTAVYYLRRADRYAELMLHGGTIGNITLAPLQNHEMRAAVSEIRSSLAHLLNIKVHELPELLEEHIHGPSDRHNHDQVFSGLLNQTAAVESQLREVIVREHTNFKRVQVTLIFVCFGFFVIVASVLYRYLRARNLYEAKIQRLNLILRAVRNVNHLITREKDRRQLIGSTCELLVDTRGLHNAWITLVDRDGKPTIHSEAGLGDLFDPARERLTNGELLPCCLRSLDQPGVLVIEDPHAECPDCPLSEKYTGRSGLAAKLEHAGRVYGFLVVSSPRQYAFDREEHTLFAELAQDIGLSLHLIRIEEERIQAERDLRESEERYRTLAANIPGSDIYLFDNDMRYVVAEGSELRSNGLSSEFYEGKSLEEAWDESLVRVMEPLYFRALQGKTASTEYACCSKYYSLTTVPIRNARKEIVGGIALSQNITERKRAEKALRLTRYSIDHTADGAYWCNENGRFIDVNPAVCRMLGYSRDQILSLSIWDIDPNFHPKRFKKQWEINKMSGATTFESSLRTRDGRAIPVEVQVNHVEFEGREYNCGFIRDITERKESLERQRFATEVLDLLNRSSEQTDTIRDILSLIKDFTGMEAVGIRLRSGDDYPYYETIGFPEAFVKRENSLCILDENTDDNRRDGAGRPLLACMCGSVIHGRTDPSKPFFTAGGSFWSNNTSELLATTTEEDRQSETRNTCNGAGYESVALIPLRCASECIGLLQLNDTRKGVFNLDLVNFFEGVGASIGIALSRKRAEEALKHSERLLRHTFEAIPDLISVHDKDYNVVLSNWHQRQDALDRFQRGSTKCYSAYIGAGEPCDPCQTREVFESKKSLRLEKTNPADGKTREINIYPVLDDAGEVTLVTETVRDITESKKAEKLQSTLLKISVATNLTRNLDELLKIIHNALGELIDTTNFYVALYDKERDVYTFPYSVDVADADDFPHEMRRKTLTDYVRRTGKALLVDEALHERLREMGEVDVVGAPSKVWLGVPLATARGVIGVVALQSYTNAGLYSESDKELMTVVSGHITMAVERKLAEEALRKSEERLRAMYEQASVGVALIADDGRWLTVNERLCQIVGYNREELLAMTCHDLTHPEDCRDSQCIVDQASRSEKSRCTCEKRFMHKDGRAVWVNISAAYVSEPDDEQQYMVAIIQDISERKEAEEMVGRFTDRLLRANRALEDKQAELEEFIYTVSHDLKAPIVSISGFAGLIKEKLGGEIDPTSARQLDRILANSTVMENLIRDLLELSRIGRMEEDEAETFSFEDLVDEVVESFSVAASQKSIRVVRVSAAPPVSGHYQRIRQLLTNLIDNAIKYMPDRADSLIEVGYDDAVRTPLGQTGAYFVRDNGEGIAPEFHERVFNMFQRAGGANGGSAAGTGIGLAIVRRIVQTHGGQIWLESQEGHGATFYFTLPGAVRFESDNTDNIEVGCEDDVSGKKSQKEVKS